MKGQSDSERLRSIAKFATTNATRDGSIRFGAPVSTPQVVAVEKFLKGRDILKFLACPEKTLRAYSRNEVSYAALPAKTQLRLRQISETYSKPWARKSATIAYSLLVARRKRQRSKSKPAEVAEQS